MDSILIRSRERAIRYGIIVLGFIFWLVFAPAGWPVVPPEECTWGQWIGARCLPLIGIWIFGGAARETWNEQIRVDRTGVACRCSSAASWSFAWHEVEQWHLFRGGWLPMETEGGTKYDWFRADLGHISFSLVGGRVVSLSLPVHGHTKEDELLAVLRRYSADRETSTVVARGESCRTKS